MAFDVTFLLANSVYLSNHLGQVSRGKWHCEQGLLLSFHVGFGQCDSQRLLRTGDYLATFS